MSGHNEVHQIVRVEVDHASKSMTSLPIDSAAVDSMMQLIVQNGFARACQVTVYTSYFLMNGRRSNPRNVVCGRVNRNLQLMSMLRMAMANNSNQFYEKQCHV